MPIHAKRRARRADLREWSRHNNQWNFCSCLARSFFSKRSVTSLEPLIRSKVEKVCEHLNHLRDSSEAIDLRQLFPCVTADIVTEYVFPQSFDFLSTSDLAPGWRQLIDQNLRASNFLKHYPMMWSVIRSIPDSFLLAMSPSLKDTIKWERTNQKVSEGLSTTTIPNRNFTRNEQSFTNCSRVTCPPKKIPTSVFGRRPVLSSAQGPKLRPIL